ncbi:MAG TPA: hypothetical protein VGD81_18455 [Opitutaceae bacterium]
MSLPRWITLLAGANLVVAVQAAPLKNARYSVELAPDGALQVSAQDAGTWTFRPEFTVLVARENPKLAMRPAGIPKVPYNVPTWQTRGAAGEAALKAVKRSNAQGGDGFDDRILEGDTKARTADLFAAAPAVTLTATGSEQTGGAIRYTFPDNADFSLSATVTLPSGVAAEPVLAFTLTPKTDAYYSVGYTGAPVTKPAEAAELWQPFIWQEKRFPAQSFLTPAFECSLPATFVRQGEVTMGVVVDAAEFPFEPLPLLDNSRFGVALRAPAGEARPMVFAPVLGGAESKRAAGAAFSFKLRLYAGRGDITVAYEDAARRLYAFKDYRRNAIVSLNETLDNIIDYGMSRYSWFIDELKGCAYSTDVPGAVKNVSALNPLNMALVADDETIFQKRAYPIIEFLLSREKFLFSLDPKQKIQSPSRALKGPSAPISELAALYGITDGASPVCRAQAEQLLGKKRTLNLDDVSPGDTWQNNLQLYRATGEARFLEKARAGADAYLAGRIAQGAADFNEPGLFFWTAFAPKWIDLLELFEATQDRRYLEAARLGARRFAMFTWVAPQIPDTEVTVNPGGNAPVYWYLKSKGHQPMHAPEERVPAWRLSEIGLTPESSGTMSGHRAIFMANHAPWMLRIAALTGDPLLHDVARSAVVGRYRNFPGYHINTARTTIYEQADYPLRPHEELSVNSFHYNHIWPHASILLDYLVTDAFARSGGAIDFPSRFIEGYAYLQSKFYGDRPGRFYGHDDAALWMPQRLLKIGSVELNYLAARGDGRLYLAFTNQSPETVTTDVVFNAEVLPAAAKGRYAVKVIADGKAAADATLRDGRFSVTVAPMGLTAVVVEGLQVTPKFQQKLLAAAAEQAWAKDYAQIPWGNARGMILNFGPAAKTAYVYVQADDAKFKEVTLRYTIGKKQQSVTDAEYPFEFTVPLPPEATEFTYQLTGLTVDGRRPGSETVTLHK